jgi:predicted unusual protein kinase regulating ubiquinone biosynthesis (AarF/ABC1/UbiB family)
MWNELFSSINSVRRVGQTGFALQKAGLNYLLHFRQKPLPYVLLGAMEELGATYIKLGQLIASSPSLFPHQYVEAFQACLDQTTPLPYATVEEVLIQEFGDQLWQLFAEIDPVPLASASIAQVHSARLMTGEDVVVKVQKPGVRNILDTDFQFLHIGAKLIELLSPKAWTSSLTDIVSEIRNGMLDECDFLKEAENIQAYEAFLTSSANKKVRVPKVYKEASTRRVLCMERFYGVSLTDIDQVRQYTPDPEQALVDALETWYASLHHCQIYHADLHAGNVMLLEDGSIGFIDFGIVGHISPKTWDALVALTIAVPSKDFEAIAQALVTIGLTRHNVNISQFADDIESLYRSLDEEESGEDFNDFIKQLTLKISVVAQRHGIRFPREFTLLVKQFLYFDRYIRLLAPELDLISDPRILDSIEY